MNAVSSFRRRMLAGDKLVGAFLKTPTSHATYARDKVGGVRA
jgi:staphyloferrin B biosynthesis citrate synthase